MTTAEPKLLPPGKAPGIENLKSQAGVFRTTLKPVTKKKKDGWADYAGVLELSAGTRAQVLCWVHADGSLGIRLELLKNKERAPRKLP